MRRLWLDANVVLRFLTGEPEEMARESRELMALAESGRVKLVLTELVLAEIVWVLSSYYSQPMERIRETLSAFITAPGVEVERLNVLLEALDRAAEKNLDFVDAYLAARATRAGEPVCTFDKSDFQRLPGEWVRPGAFSLD